MQLHAHQTRPRSPTERPNAVGRSVAIASLVLKYWIAHLRYGQSIIHDVVTGLCPSFKQECKGTRSHLTSASDLAQPPTTTQTLFDFRSVTLQHSHALPQHSLLHSVVPLPVCLSVFCSFFVLRVRHFAFRSKVVFLLKLSLYASAIVIVLLSSSSRMTTLSS